MSPIWHQFCDFLRLVGLRDRLRCPGCYAVGTWKPHGGWLDREDARKVRRWICKFCGLYDGPEGRKRARYSEERGYWVLDDDPTYPRSYAPEFWWSEHVIKARPWAG